MALLPGDPGWLGNQFETDPHQTPAPPDEGAPTRSWPRAALDTGLGVVGSVYEPIRAATSGIRSLADDPDGMAAQADRIVGNIQRGIEEAKSPRARQIEKESFLPGVDDQSAWKDLPAKAGETVAGLLPWIAATAVSGGVGALAKTFDIVGMGAQGFGAYNGKLRDYFDQTPASELEKNVPGWNKALQDANGNELAARDALYKKAFSTSAAVMTTMAGAAGGAGIGGALGTREIPKLLPRVGAGAAEGALAGAAMGGAGAYGQETTDVNLGRKSAINTEAIARGMGEGAIPMAGVVGGMHAVGGKAREASGKVAEKPAGSVDMAQAEALRESLPDPMEPPGGPRPGAGGQIFPADNDPGAGGRPPPVVTPEKPLAPSFPEIERPGLPGYGDFVGGADDVEPPLLEYHRTLPPDQTAAAPQRPGMYPEDTQTRSIIDPALRPTIEARTQPREPFDTGAPRQVAARERLGDNLADYSATIPPEVITPPAPEAKPKRGKGGKKGGGEPPPEGTPPAVGGAGGMPDFSAPMPGELTGLVSKADVVKQASKKRGKKTEAAEVTPEVTEEKPRITGTLTAKVGPKGMAALAATERQLARRETIRVGDRDVEVERTGKRIEPEDLRTAERYNAWTGEKLSDEEARSMMVQTQASRGKKGETIELKKPPYFDTDEARRSRFESGVPLEWEEFKKGLVNAETRKQEADSAISQTQATRQAGERVDLRAGGKAHTEQSKANQSRRERQKVEREELIKKAIEGAWEKVPKKDRKRLLEAAATDRGMARGMAAAKPGESAPRFPDFSKEPGEAREGTSIEKAGRESTMATAAEVHTIVKDQIDRWEKAKAKWLKENRERGEAMSGRGHDVMRTPKGKRGRSGAEGDVYFSRLARQVLFEDRLRKLIARDKTGEDVTRETRTLLDQWQLDENQDVVTARASRKAESAEITEQHLGTGARAGETPEQTAAREAGVEAAIDKLYRTMGYGHSSEEALMARSRRERMEDAAKAERGIDPHTELDELPPEEAGAIRRIVEQNIKEDEDLMRTHGAPDPAAMDEVLQATIDRTRERSAAEEARLREWENRSEGAVPAHLATDLVRNGALDFDTAEDLLRADANASVFAGKVRETMNKRLADLMREVAYKLPKVRTAREGKAPQQPRKLSEQLSEARRSTKSKEEIRAEIQAALKRGKVKVTKLEPGVAEGAEVFTPGREALSPYAADLIAMAARVDTMHERPVEAIRMLNEFIGSRDEERYASEEIEQKIVDWMADRVAADKALRGVEAYTGMGAGTGIPVEPKPKRMTQAEVKKIWEKPEPAAEPPVTREVTREPKPGASEDTIDALSDHLVDPNSDIEALAQTTGEHLMKVRTVKDSLSSMMDRTSELDQHYRDIVEKVVPDVPIVQLHDDLYDATMRKLAPENVDSDGYYDAGTDRIYVRSKFAEGTSGVERDRWRALLKHETAHAITLAALERDAPARARLEDIMKTAAAREALWSGTMDAAETARVRATLGDVHEFVSELWSNDNFRRALASVPITRAEAVRWRVPRITHMLSAFKEFVRRAVSRLFGAHNPNTALNEALINSMDLFADVVKKGRPDPFYAESAAKRGAPGKIGDWLRNSQVGESGRDIAYRWNRKNPSDPTSRGWSARGLFAHTLYDLAERGNDAYKAVTRPVLDAVSRLNTARHRIAVDRGDDQMLKRLSEFMQKPQADKAADFLLRESKHGAFADEALHAGKNAFVKKTGLSHYQIRSTHDRMRAEYDQLARDIPGFAAMRKELHDWGNRVRDEDLYAQIKDAVTMDDITHDAAGARDPVAIEALTKTIMRKPLSNAEEAWVARQDEDKLKALAAEYRLIPEFARQIGPYVPFKRHGGFAISGEYTLPQHDPATGRRLEDQGYYEFYTPEAAQAYADKVSAGVNTKLLSAQRRVYRKDDSKPREEWVAEKPDRFPDFNEPPPGPEYETRYQLHFNTKHLEFHENERKAAERRDELLKEGVAMRPEVELVSDRTGYQSPHFMSRAMQTVIDRAKRSSEYKAMSPAERQAWERRLNTEMAKQVLAAGGRAPGLPREYVEGMSRDLIENYAEASVQSAANLAHARHGLALRDAFEALQKHTDETKYHEGNALRAAVTDEMSRRVYTVQDPFVHGIWGAATNRLLQATYTAKLAGTSFLGINMMEPSIIGLPLLAGKYGPWAAFKGLRDAYSVAGGRKLLGAGFQDFKNAALRRNAKWADYDETLERNIRGSGAADADDLVKMMKDLADKGLFDRSSVNEISVLREPNPGPVGSVLDYFDNTFRGMNTSVEVMNRAVLAISAFRLQKGDYAAKLRAAEDSVYRGAGQYAAWNAPPAFNHPVARLALQFKKYPQRIMSNYIQAAIGTMRGDREKMAQFAMMLGMQAVAAGVMGMPTEVFSIPVNALNIATGGATPSWDDIQGNVYHFMANEMGPEAAEVVAHGFPRLAGVDLSTRLGQDSMVFFGSPDSTKPKDLLSSAAGVLLGAPGSTIVNTVGGIQNLSKAAQEAATGSNERAAMYAKMGARQLIPLRQVTDIWDAYRKSTGDSTTRTKGGAATGPEYTAGQAVWRALGFTPAVEARRSEQKRVEGTLTKAAAASRKDWTDRYATASPAERPMVQAQVNEWNASHPPQERIKQSDLIKAVSARRKQESKPGSDLGINFNSRTRPYHEELSRVYNTGG